METNDVLGSV